MTNDATGPNELAPIGTVRSELTDPASAPMQGDEGAPEAWLDLDEAVRTAARDR